MYNPRAHTASLLTTCNKLVVNKLPQAMRTRPNICCKMSTHLLQFCAFLSVLMSGLMKTVLDNIVLPTWFNVVNNSGDDSSYGVCGGGYYGDNCIGCYSDNSSSCHGDNSSGYHGDNSNSCNDND